METESNRKQIVQQIKFRDSILKRRGFAEFTYTYPKMGFSSTRRLILHFNHLKISFVEKDSKLFTDDIECVLSTFQSETPGMLLVNYRSATSADESMLKEHKWTFKQTDAPEFQRLLNLMMTNGRKLVELYRVMNKAGKKAIEKTDLDALVAIESASCAGLRGVSTAAMLAECDVEGVGKEEFTLADLLAITSSSPPSTFESVRALLLEWVRVSAQRTSIQYSAEESASSEFESQNASASSQNVPVKRVDKIDLIEGEREMSRTPGVIFTMANPTAAESVPNSVGKGDASFTNFRIILYDLASPAEEFRYDAPPYPAQISLPFSSIARVDLDSDNNGYDIIVICKDLRVVRMAFATGKQFAMQYVVAIQDYAFPSDLRTLFAFSRYGRVPAPLLSDSGNSKAHASQRRLVTPVKSEDAPMSPSQRPPITVKPGAIDGWKIFDPKKEFERQGLLGKDSKWRLWSDNYELVPTYPSAFILPAALNDAEIVEAANFRSRRRLPALTWRSSVTGACLCRSSQPNAGLFGKTNLCDKLLHNLYRIRGDGYNDTERVNPTTYYIIDCRSKVAANANAVMGKGIENFNSLVQTQVFYCGIGNIHVMRSSIESLHSLLVPFTPRGASAVTRGMKGLFNRSTSTATPQSSEDDSMSGPDVAFMDNSLYARQLLSRVETTGWIDHVRCVITSSVLVAETLSSRSSSVLVHCSDGWDRTAQVVATAQLILDPYFRSIEGLAVLIEKDWCGFGHKFHDRLGHGRPSNGKEGEEMSPVFVQVCLSLSC